MKPIQAVLLVCTVAALANASKIDPEAVKKFFAGKEDDLIPWVTDYLKEYAFPDMLGSPEVDRVDYAKNDNERSLIKVYFIAKNMSINPVKYLACSSVIYVRYFINGAHKTTESFVFDPKKDMKCVDIHHVRHRIC